MTCPMEGSSGAYRRKGSTRTTRCGDGGGPTSRPRDDCVSTPRVGDMLWESWMSRACPMDTTSLVREMYITCEVPNENLESKELSS